MFVVAKMTLVFVMMTELMVLQMTVMVTVMVTIWFNYVVMIPRVDVMPAVIGAVPEIYARALVVAITEMQADRKTAFRERGSCQRQKSSKCNKGQQAGIHLASSRVPIFNNGFFVCR